MRGVGREPSEKKSEKSDMGVGPGAGRGGAREGAGRPKGVKNKLDRTLQKRLADEGADPVDVLTDLMSDIDDRRLRLEAAKALLPYAYPRLSSQDVNVTGEQRQNVILEIARPDDGSDGDGD